MRRRVVLAWGLLLALALLSAAASVLMQASPNDRICHATYEAIEIGMHVTQVEALLGGPEGDYRTDDVFFTLTNREMTPHPSGLEHRTWLGNGGQIFVSFHADGTVGGKVFLRVAERRHRSPLICLRRWLRL